MLYLPQTGTTTVPPGGRPVTGTCRGEPEICPPPPRPKSKETPLGKQGVTAEGAKRLLYWKRALKPSLPTRHSISARVLSKGVRLLGTLGKA